jgi:hypothetical protein
MKPWPLGSPSRSLSPSFLEGCPVGCGRGAGPAGIRRSHPGCTAGTGHGDHVVLQWGRRCGSLRRGDQVWNRATCEKWRGSPGALDLHRTCNAAQGLQNRSRGPPRLCRASQETARHWRGAGSGPRRPCRSRKATVSTVLRPPDQRASLAKSAREVSRFTRGVMLCRVLKTAGFHCLISLLQDLT